MEGSVGGRQIAHREWTISVQSVRERRHILGVAPREGLRQTPWKLRGAQVRLVHGGPR